jgi:23S rRNA pseudouridine1911/1915/1917 synthase
VGLPGSGKSAVLDALASHGYPVWSADQCVAKLYEPEADAWHMLRSRFGDRFVSSGAPVDKKALLAAMRGSEIFRRELMELLYPMVMHKLEDFWGKNARSRAAFAEVPMLLEAGWLGKDVVDTVVGVRCAEAVRRQRLTAKRGWDQAMIALVESWQWPEEKKLKACGHVIDNSGSLGEVARAVDELLPLLHRERASRPTELLAWMRAQSYA